MKKTTTSFRSPQLSLRREIVRTLSTSDLRAVVGASQAVVQGCGDTRVTDDQTRHKGCTTAVA